MFHSIYIIAGEASGDFIGAKLMEALNQQTSIQYHGIGGDLMTAQGLRSLFPMQELSMMGFAEILPHIFRLKRRIKETVADIIARKPDVIITIDSPGFTFRVVKALRESGIKTPCIHYVAPTVWAYKPHRAAKTAKLFDALMVLLPFEPPYFEKEDLKTHFVGHPKAWEWKEKGDGVAFRQKHQIPVNATVLGMMPGSRIGEIQRHLPVFQETAKRLSKEMAGLHVVMPVNSDIRERIQGEIEHWPAPVTLSTQTDEKKDAFAACNLALAKSGTVALETALAGIPTITTFRANPISIWLIRRMVQIPYANLLNIMAFFDGKEAPIPELLQEQCNATELSQAVLSLWQNPSARQTQLDSCRLMFERLGTSDAQSPSDKAAAVVLDHLP